MKQRIFIAINLPEDIKITLADYQNKWPELPARWTKPENLHITLIFFGYAIEKEVFEVGQIIKNVIVQQKSFLINLHKISYDSSKIIPPRMIWAIGEKSDDFISLRSELEKQLSKFKNIRFIPEKREVSPHITLARIKEWEWRRIEPEERPEIEELIDLSFQVNSIELMGSIFKKTGPEYKILESYKLKI